MELKYETVTRDIKKACENFSKEFDYTLERNIRDFEDLSKLITKLKEKEKNGYSHYEYNIKLSQLLTIIKMSFYSSDLQSIGENMSAFIKDSILGKEEVPMEHCKELHERLKECFPKASIDFGYREEGKDEDYTVLFVLKIKF